MALAFLFEFPGGSQEQFDQVLEKTISVVPFT